jgi:nitrogen-specific signal transduction histidine kinase
MLDFTGRKHLEAQFYEAQKMESAGRLAAGAAHDFNNLIQVIRGRAERILKRTEAGDTLQKEVKLIDEAGKKAVDLTRNLLAFGAKQVLRPAVLDLGRLIENMVPMLSSLLSDAITVVVQVPGDPVCVMADQSQIEQMVMNLAVNAGDAMPQGGTLTLTLGRRTIDAVAGDGPSSLLPGTYAVLSVSDTGCGINHAIIPQIFDPFFTTKSPAAGTGLGLSMVYGMVKQSGGAIAVDSREGRGTTFHISLPLTEKEVPVEPEKQQPDEQEAGGELEGTILFVEDEELVRSLLAEELEERGLNVIQAGDYGEAVRRAGDHSGIDLIITDVVLKGRGGLDAAQAVLELHPQAGVLFTSGCPESQLEKLATFPRSDFIEKPFTIDELMPLLRKVLSRRS